MGGSWIKIQNPALGPDELGELGSGLRASGHLGEGLDTPEMKFGARCKQQKCNFLFSQTG